MAIGVLIAFVLLAGLFFVLLTRWQRGDTSPPPDDAAGHPHDHCCDHDHSHSHPHDHSHDHAHHDHKDGGCCGGKH